MERPELNADITTEELRTYYYLKEELMNLCRERGLSTSGSKGEIIDRLCNYIENGTAASPKRVKRTRRTSISLDDTIEENIVFSELHRQFFKDTIDPGFKFNVRFCRWLRENPGRTYSDAVAAYPDSLVKDGTIDGQFRYNTYIRDFFADNPEMGLNDAIICWNRKKMTSQQHYERADLDYLNIE